MTTLKELSTAFEIFAEYNDDPFPLYASREKLTVTVNSEKVSEDDKKTLKDLGFYIDEEHSRFYYFT